MNRIALMKQIRRAFAAAAGEAGGPEKLQLTLTLPHQTVYKGVGVDQVNLPTSSGDVGILARHVPTILQLKPGVMQVLSDGSKKEFFVSGGFAAMHATNELAVTSLEAFPLDQLSADEVGRGILEAQKKLGAAGITETEKAETEVILEVLQSLQAALKQ